MSIVNSTFAVIVEREFDSLCRQFHFRETKTDERLVRFESKTVHVTFYLTRFNEVEVAFGRLVDETAEPPGFGVFDLLYLADKEVAARSRAKIATTPEQLKEAVREILDILRIHGLGVLSGQTQAFEQLARPRTSELELYSLSTVAVHVRPKAEAAFRVGDYAEAAQLYQSIRMVLTAVELRKLAIAEKKMSGAP